jgi:hypothetical protein
MDYKVIGFKKELPMILIVLCIIGGIALIVVGILSFVFLLQGAIGGGITGGLVGLGAYIMGLPIILKKLPHELIKMSNTTVYLQKKQVDFNAIQEVKARGMSLIIIPIHGRRITQSFVADAAACADTINQKILEIRQTQRTN